MGAGSKPICNQNHSAAVLPPLRLPFFPLNEPKSRTAKIPPVTTSFSLAPTRTYPSPRAESHLSVDAVCSRYQHELLCSERCAPRKCPPQGVRPQPLPWPIARVPEVSLSTLSSAEQPHPGNPVDHHHLRCPVPSAIAFLSCRAVPHICISYTGAAIPPCRQATPTRQGTGRRKARRGQGQNSRV